MKSKDLKGENYWEGFVNALFEPILVLDFFGKILYANQASCHLFGKQIEKLIDTDFSYPLELDTPTEIEIEIYNSNKEIQYADVYMREGAWKSEKAYIVTLHDITKRKDLENRLNLFANIFTFANEGILVTDSNLNIIDVNPGFTNITQYKKEDVLGKKPNILKSGIQDAEFYKDMWLNLEKKGYWYGELWNKKKNNEIYPELLSISEVKNSDGDLVNYVGIFYDITQEELQKKQLIQMAYYDSLTGLPNRNLFMDRLETAMINTKRIKNFIALVFIDIDNFKTINDTYGQKIGDQLLINISQLLTESLRENDTVARLSADEFLILIETLVKPLDYKVVIDKLFENFKKPLTVDSHEFYITLSAGISFYPQKINISPGTFLSQANQAMYQAKASGKKKYALFDLGLDLEMRKRENLIQEIRLAIRNDELKLYYQPKVNMKTGKVFGLEGLIRWNQGASFKLCK